MKLALTVTVTLLVALHVATAASAHVLEQAWIRVHPHVKKHRPRRAVRFARARRVVRLALHYRGVPYVWGGTTPSGFDCSGLLQYVFRKVGVWIPRTTWTQMRVGHRVSFAGLRAGDAVYLNGGEHGGLYLGRGLIVDAPHTGARVRIDALRWYRLTAARRFW